MQIYQKSTEANQKCLENFLLMEQAETKLDDLGAETAALKAEGDGLQK